MGDTQAGAAKVRAVTHTLGHTIGLEETDGGHVKTPRMGMRRRVEMGGRTSLCPVCGPSAGSGSG
jgi:hypothetical protein